MKKLLYLTNIPTPYRIKRFNDMVSILQKQCFDLEVIFMAETEPDRNWVIDKNNMKFVYKIWPGFHFAIGKFFAHFNPSILWRLTKYDYDVVVIAGISCPTLWLAKLFIPKDIKKIMSVETNLMGNTTKKGVKFWIKKILLTGYDAYQVTGNPQKEYIQYFYPGSIDSRYIVLPNLIDHEVFHSKNIPLHREKYNISFNKLMCIIPARILSYKIPLAFIEATKVARNIEFVIVGQGEATYEFIVRDTIIKNCLPIKIIPFVQQAEMSRLYATADMFCLPSQEDPSPLSPIEAIASGLPLMVSNVIGNINEVLREKYNGFSFDPWNDESIQRVIKQMDSISKEALEQMKKESLALYDANFNNEKCLINYACGISELVKIR